MGALVNTTDKSDQEAQLESLEQSFGKTLGIQLVYGSWNGITTSWINSNSQMQGDLTHNRVTNLSWTCGDYLTNIAAASAKSTGQKLADYNTIVQTGLALKGYKGLVVLRPMHEFNNNTTGKTTNSQSPKCFAGLFTPGKPLTHAQKVAEGQALIGAFENIHNIFHALGVTNVAIEWCPALGGPVSSFSDWDLYLPPSKFIDWIGIDGYDGAWGGAPDQGFKSLFGPFYSHYAPHGLPIIVSETNEIPPGNPDKLPAPSPDPWTQKQYFKDMQTTLTDGTFPLIKAVNLFDHHGTYDWIIGPDGLAAMKAAVNSGVFIQAP